MDEKISSLKKDIVSYGREVVVKGQKTKEVINKSLSWTLVRNPFSPKREFLHLEKVSHRDYSKGVDKIIKKLSSNLVTRKAVWYSRHCITMVHCLVRLNNLYSTIYFRSSNVERLETDLYIITEGLLKIRNKFNFDRIFMNVIIGSAHVVV